jgi:hypothetical protein
MGSLVIIQSAWFHLGAVRLQLPPVPGKGRKTGKKTMVPELEYDIVVLWR